MQQRILEKAPKGSSDWASPIVVVWKPDEDLRIYGGLQSSS